MSSMRPADGAASERFDSRHLACSIAVAACLTWFSAALISSGRAGSLATARLASAWLIRATATSTAVCASSNSAWVAMPRSSRSVARAKHAPLLLGLGVGGTHHRVEHGDFFRPPAELQVGELRLCLRKCCFGLRHRDLGVVRLHFGDRGAGLDAVAALHRDRLDLRDLDRREQHVVALDIADGKRRGAGAGRKQRGGERNRAQEAHGLSPFLAARIAARLSTAIAAMAFACSGPMSVHSMRRNTASRAMRK